MNISFCTVVSNRLHQFRQTFEANLAAIGHRHQWVILDWRSKDGLGAYLDERLAGCTQSIVHAQSTAGAEEWHASRCKNVAHIIASGDILVNLDCDNFIDNIPAEIDAKPFADLWHLWSGTYGDGTFGRIAIRRPHFYKLGGYDEEFLPAGHQDQDLINRAKAAGMRISKGSCKSHLPIKNSKEDTLRHVTTDLTWEEMNRRNKERSEENIRKGKFVANQGIFSMPRLFIKMNYAKQP